MRNCWNQFGCLRNHISNCYSPRFWIIFQLFCPFTWQLYFIHVYLTFKQLGLAIPASPCCLRYPCTPTCQGDEIGRVVELIAWIPKSCPAKNAAAEMSGLHKLIWPQLNLSWMQFCTFLQFPFVLKVTTLLKHFHNPWTLAAFPSDFSTPMCLISNSMNFTWTCAQL